MQATVAKPASAKAPAKSGLIDQVELGAALRHYFSQPDPTEVVLLNVQVHCIGDEVLAQQAVAQVLLKYCRPCCAYVLPAMSPVVERVSNIFLFKK